MFGVIKSMLGGDSTETITPDKVAGLTQKGAIVVDVREQAEIARSGKIKGAMHIPVGEIAVRADPASSSYDKRLSKELPIIVYCASGMRSASAAKTLKALGFTKVYNLGAFSGWAASGGATEAL